MSPENVEILERITKNTNDRLGLILNICFDYGSYDELTEATKQIAKEVKDNLLNIEDITEETITNHLYTKDLLPLDLLIRPSGEVRLSNFMLWQAAYSELYFCKVYWPSFSKLELIKAITEYSNRERRYGGLKG